MNNKKHKRTIEESSAVGNAAKMREALEALVCMIDKYDSGNPLWWHSGAKGVKTLKAARAALFSPPRNCDVGSEQEQKDRFESFCARHFRYSSYNPCSRCPIYKDGDLVPCAYRFLQLPYEKEDK